MFQGGVCVCVCVEVVFAGQADTVRDSLRVGSGSKIIMAIKISYIFTMRRTCNIVTFLCNNLLSYIIKVTYSSLLIHISFLLLWK